MDANYAYDITLIANTPAQAECLMHSLEQTAKNIGLYVNSDKRECVLNKMMPPPN